MAFPAPSDTPYATGTGAVFQITSTPLAVRRALREVLDHSIMSGLSKDVRGTAELVLAEALNNIVEHAYGTDDGQIELQLHQTGSRLSCDVFDAGMPMPEGELPAGLAQIIGEDDDLPEGGFGWFLIRTLTEDLTYRRIDARNHLSFKLNIEQ